MDTENRHLTMALIIMAALVAYMFMVPFPHAYGQDHKHPPQDEAIHLKYYRTWTMPDNRKVSCCHDEDCFPAQAKNVNGTWFARKDDTEDWVEIPRNKVDIGLPDSRDPPDSRAHLCGRKYTFQGASNFTVFCFTAGAGG